MLGGCRMGTKIIVDGRCTGKKTKAIIESAKTGYPILAFDRRMANYIVSQADDIGIKIPTPLTLQQVRNGRLDGHKREDRLIVDEGLMILEQMLGMSIHMITMSEREEYKDMFTHEYLGKWVPGGGEVD